jgi:hypothetical protein
MSNPMLWRFRVKLDEDGEGWVFSAIHPLEFFIPPRHPIIEDKLSLLKLCDAGQSLEGVGKRKFDNTFYLWLSEQEVDELEMFYTTN